MEYAIRGFYRDLSIDYPATLVDAAPDLTAPGLLSELVRIYKTFESTSKWMNSLVNSNRFKGIAELIDEFQTKGFEIDQEPGFLQYRLANQEIFDREGYRVNDVVVNSQGHNMHVEDIMEAIRHLESGTAGDWKLRTSDIEACILLLAQEMKFLLPLDEPQDVAFNNSVYILSVTNIKELAIHSYNDSALFRKTAIAHKNMEEAERSGSPQAQRVSNVAWEASKALFVTEHMEAIYKAMHQFSRMTSTKQNEFRKPRRPRPSSVTSSKPTLKRRSDWFEASGAAESEPMMSMISFNPYWRAIIRVVNLGNYHWILLVIVRHGPELQKVSCVVFDSLNLWRKPSNIKHIREMIGTILSCNAMGMATLGDQGAIPRLINGLRVGKQEDDKSCGLHAINYAQYAVNYFSTDDSNHTIKFSLAHFLDYMNGVQSSDKICNGVVKHTFIRGLKFLAVFAHFSHHMTNSALYKPQNVLTKKDLRDHIPDLKLEQDRIDIYIDIACIDDFNERPHIMRLDNDILDATVDQIIAQCSNVGVDRNSRKLYDISKSRPVPANATLKIYVEDLYKEELKQAVGSMEPLPLHFVIISQNLQGDAVMRTLYDKVTFEIDLGLGRAKRKYQLDPLLQDQISYGSSVAEFKRAILGFIPSDIRDNHVVRFYNKTTQKFLHEINIERPDKEDEKIPLVTLGDFHNGDEVAVVLLRSLSSIIVMGFSAPFSERTEHYVKLDSADTYFSSSEDVTLTEIIKTGAATIPALRHHSLRRILAEYDIYNDRNEIITEDLLYLSWTYYMTKMRLSSSSITVENVGYVASGSVFLLLIARKGNRPTDGIKMTLKGSDQNNDYEPFVVDGISPFMRLSEFTKRVKEAAQMMDDDTPLYYDYVDAGGVVNEVTLVNSKRLKKLRDMGVADPILLHLGFYNANPAKRHVQFYTIND